MTSQHFHKVLAFAVVAGVLASCGGGGSHGGALPQAPGATSVPAADYNGPLANATFQIRIPKPTSGSSIRKPAYVSSATKSLKFVINSSSTVSGTATTGILSTYNARAWSHFDTGTLPSASCPASGPDFICTVSFQVPPGTDNITFSACDGTGGTCAGQGAVAGNHVLSQQVQSFTVVTGSANTFTGIVLDANANTMIVTAQSGNCASNFAVPNAATVGTIGTSTTTFSVTYKDAAGKTIVGPGLPMLTVDGHTNDNGGSGYTDANHINVKVTQSTQTFSLTQTFGTGSGSVPVSAAPANSNSSSDGLSFAPSMSFTYSAGTAPPANFLAVIEQSGTTGSVNFFTANPATGAISTYATTPSLTSTSNDVDNPNDMVFDTNADLMVANGGAGGGDLGNFACVPAGSISTGANNATVVTANANDPGYIALGTNSTVAIGNIPKTSNPQVAEYAQDTSGFYAALSSAYNITQALYPNLGTQGLVALSTSGSNTAGTFAMSITDGSATAANSHVLIKRPGIAPVSSSSNAKILDPVIGYDAANFEIVTASQQYTGTAPAITFLSFLNDQTAALAGSGIAQMPIADDGCFESGTTPYAGCAPQGPNTANGNGDMQPYRMAVSPSGYVAVAGAQSASGEPEVWVYNNNPAQRYSLGAGAPISYDGMDPTGSTYVYGNSGAVTDVVTAMRWLTGTVLLVSLQSTTGTNVATTAQGLYMYDVTQSGPACTPAGSMTTTCYDFINLRAIPNTVKEIGFLAISSVPKSVAFKP